MTYKIDDKDKKIIEILKEHSDYTTRQIAKKTLFPITTVHFRIKRLKKEKIIKKFTIDINHEKIGLPISFFISVTVDYNFINSKKSLDQEEIAKSIKKINGVQEVMLMTGETDILVKVLAKDVNELNQIVTKQLRNIEGVDKTRTSIVISEIN